MLVVCRTHKTVADLMDEFRNFSIIEKELQTRRLTFPIPAADFVARDGEDTVRRLLSLLTTGELVGIEPRVLSEEAAGLNDSTIVEVHVLEADAHIFDKFAQLMIR